jgi:hypothetical protein
VRKTATIENIHDPESGRIGASLVADLYGLRLRQIADALGQNYETLRKNPAREEAQRGLGDLVHACQMCELFGNSKHGVRWLNRPMPEDEVRPIDVLLGRDGLSEFSSLVGRMATGAYR